MGKKFRTKNRNRNLDNMARFRNPVLRGWPHRGIEFECEYVSEFKLSSEQLQNRKQGARRMQNVSFQYPFKKVLKSGMIKFCNELNG